MIDFENINTIPKSIISIIEENKLEIRKELLKETERDLAGHKWQGGSISIECFKSCCEEILLHLNDKLIIGFHCTKLINPLEIRKTGLLRLNPADYEEKMKAFLKANISNHRNLISVEKNFMSFKEINGYEHRENMIWFLLTKSLVHSSGCNDFLNYYGGETITRIQISEENLVFPILLRTGFPTVVSFKFKFNEIPLYQRNSIVRNFIKSLVQDKSYHYYEKFEAEAHLKRDIKPEEILEIYCDKNLKRLKIQ